MTKTLAQTWFVWWVLLSDVVLTCIMYVLLLHVCQSCSYVIVL